MSIIVKKIVEICQKICQIMQFACQKFCQILKLLLNSDKINMHLASDCVRGHENQPLREKRECDLLKGGEIIREIHKDLK